MIISLRKRHLQAWILIAFLLLLLIPVAVLYTPDYPTVKSGNLEVSGNNIIQTIEDNGFTLQLIEGSEDHLVRLVLKEAIKSPASFFYAIVDGKEIPLERTGAVGEYVGKLKKSKGKISKVEIRDDLDQELIFEINLK